MRWGFRRAGEGPSSAIGLSSERSSLGDTANEGAFALERERLLSELRSSPALLRLPPAAQKELASLQQESDPQFFYEALYGFGLRQEQSARDEAAAAVYTGLAGGPLQTRAQQRLDALMGRGAVGPRAEFLLRRFASEASDPTTLLAMGVAGTAFRLTRLGVMSRLVGSEASFFTRGFGARATAGIAGFLVEAPAFSLTGRVGRSALGREQEWNARALGRELASSYLVLGGMRLAGWGSEALSRSLAGPSLALRSQPLQFATQSLFSQGGMLTGILLGHRLEQWAGLRPAQNGATTLIDSLALLLQFHVAGNLSRGLTGSRIQAWEQGLEVQTELLSRESIPTRPKPPPLGNSPGLAWQGAGNASPASEILSNNTFMMSASGRGKRPGNGTTDEVPPSSVPANQNNDPLTVVPANRVGPERLRVLPRGGVMVQTSSGWIQLGVPMWTNKDAFEIFLQGGGPRLDREDIRRLLPTLYLFDMDYVARHDGLLPADFMQYMYFINRGQESTLLAPDLATARQLREFLDLSYQGPNESDLNEQVRGEYAPGAVGIPQMGEEIHRGFPSPEPETLRSIAHLDEAGQYAWRDVRLQKLGPQHYEIFDQGNSLGEIDLREFPLPQVTAKAKPTPEARAARRRVLREGRPALWPIGTGHGFTPREETSGFMIWNRGKAILVDPPSSTLDYLQRNGLPLSAVDGLLLTHGHTDHYGNAVPQLRALRPDLKIYTTPTIFRMLQQQYHLALGDSGGDWNFVPLYPQAFSEILGLHLRPEYGFHPVPALGFEIYDQPDAQRGQLAVSFTGDTFADHVDVWKHTQAVAPALPILSVARTQQILRHNAQLLASRHQAIPPVFLIEGGVQPIHIPPARTREMLDYAESLGVNTSRVFVYHVAAEAAAAARVPKWVAGEAGFIDLSEYFPRTRIK